MITITKGQALEALTEAVKDKGADYRYQRPVNIRGEATGCLYTDKDSQPSCIVGHALAYVGVPIEVLHAIDWGGGIIQSLYTSRDEYLRQYSAFEYEVPEIVEEDEYGLWYRAEEGMDDTGIDETDVRKWLHMNDVYIDQSALNLFASVQLHQDSGMPWGKAVSQALVDNGSFVK